MNKKNKSSMDGYDYHKLKIHPLLKPIQQVFEFYTLGVAFISMPEFQKSILQITPAFSTIINRYNNTVNLKQINNEIHAQTKPYLINTGRLMAIGIFDFLESSKYNKELNKTNEFRFVKFIRHGAAHNNKFIFKPSVNFEKKPAIWRDMTISKELEGKTVIPDYIHPTQLILLMQDLTDLIEKNDKSSSLH